MAGLTYPARNDYSMVPILGSIMSDPSAYHSTLGTFVKPVYEDLASLLAEKLLRNFELHLCRVSSSFDIVISSIAFVLL